MKYREKILITGATSGIGKEITRSLLSTGKKVIATGRSESKLADLSKELESPNLVTLLLDVTSSDSILSAVKQIGSDPNLGTIDVLINNAGYSQPGPVSEVSIDSIRRQYETNLFGLVEVTQAFLLQLKKSKGMIINISSILGQTIMPFNSIYSSSKFALEAVSDGLRIELAPFGIKVVIVEPGAIKTEFLDTALSNLPQEDRIKSAYREIYDRLDKILLHYYRNVPGPEVVAEKVVKVLASENPKPRYVAPDSQRQRLFMMKNLPVKVTDKIKSRIYGLDKMGNRSQQP